MPYCGDFKGRNGDYHRSKRTGKPCKSRIKEGHRACKFHGGATKKHKAKTESRVMVMEVEDRARRMVARAGVDASPEEVLWDNLCLANAKRIIWGQMVADLDYAGEMALQADDKVGYQRGWAEWSWRNLGTDDHPIIKGELDKDPILVQTKDGVKVHPFLEEEKHWVGECRQMAKDCMVLGLKEREVRLAERQGEAMVQLVQAFVRDSAWSKEVRGELQAKGRAVFAKHLRLLESREAS